MSIFFFNESVKFTLRNKTEVRLWLEKCAKSEKVQTGDLNYIFCSDKHLRKINKQFLQHDYFTDIITFPSSDPGSKPVSGDIFISVDRVRENAGDFGTRVADELHRVMAHGLLHLCGYGDKTEKEIKKMRSLEDKWLRKRGEKLI